MPPVDAMNAYNVYFAQGHVPLGLGALRNRTLDDQYEADVAYWFGTLRNPGPRWKQLFLYRMWALIWHGGLWMRAREGGPWQAWSHTDIPIASCLSHGGRVLVQLTRDPNRVPRVWNWLWSGHPPQTRGAATHGVKFGIYGVMPDGRPKYVMETKTGESGTHFGVNIAGGGLGNRNPISGNRISDDGRHGHLYICYVAPTATRRGALMFGAEDSAPIDRARTQPNQVLGGIAGFSVLLPVTLIDIATGAGWARQPLPFSGWGAIFPKGQTGAYHGLGVSGKYSVTGSHKFKDIARDPAVLVPSGNDMLFVNPPVDVWRGVLSDRLRFHKAWLGEIPPPVDPGTNATRGLPTAKEFAAATSGGRFHFRDARLEQMDEWLKAGESTTRRAQPLNVLNAFIQLGHAYMAHSPDPDQLKDRVWPYIDAAENVRDQVEQRP